MNTDEIEQELGTLQLSDSFFPSGIFTTSNGLEFLFAKKKIQNINELIKIITNSIRQQIGPLDCVAISSVFECIKNCEYDKIREVDNVIFASKMIKEIRDATSRSGIQTVKCVSEFVKNDDLLNMYKNDISEGKVHGMFPVAFAVCSNALNIKKEKSMIMMVYGYIVGSVGAALRLGLIQHFESQKIIHQIKPIVAEIIKEYSDSKSINMAWQFSPQMDIVQMSHEKMDSKMFIT